MQAGRIRNIGLMLLISAVYFAAAKLGLTMAYVAEQVTVVWPPTGIALCAMLIFGYRFWPAIAIGAFLANLTTDPSLFTATGIAAGNTLEALAGAYLLKRYVHFEGAMERLRDVFGLILMAAFGSTAISATIGVTVLCLSEEQPWSHFGSVWFVWWLGDAMGALIMVPLVMTSYEWIKKGAKNVTGIEFWSFVGVLSTVNWVIFTREYPASGHNPPEYVVFPFLIWAALRFGPAGAALSIFITSWMAIAGTVHGYGPFALGTTGESLVSLQLFMLVFAGTGLILGGAHSERETAQSQRLADQQRMRDHEQTMRESAEALAGDNARLYRETQEASSRKDEFLAMLAHELRNPLAPIRNALQIMHLRENDTDILHWARDLITRQVKHLGRLLDALLDVARITQGKIYLDRQCVDMTATVRESVNAILPQLLSRSITMTESIPKDTVFVFADPTRMEQIISNLLSNAIKFTNAGSIAVTLDKEANDAVLRIRDSGVGISEELLPRIFEPFVQGPRTPTSSEGGLGIGLTLVHNLVSMHGGTIRAFSKGLDRGSEFIVRLPLFEAGAPTQSENLFNEGRTSES